MRYIHGDISHFLYKVIKRGEMMTDILCCKSKCLNNKKGNVRLMSLSMTDYAKHTSHRGTQEKVHAVCVLDLMGS